jgi:DeoR/GlpR family transcriptional regulator of sugar metabolism
MLKVERQNEILEILAREKRVIAKDLSLHFLVSEDTIRRDLQELNEKKLLKRVHSGAISISPPQTSFRQRENVFSDKKIQLAHEALKLLKEGSTIIMDTGTTNLQLARIIPIDFKCTIITNSPPIAVTFENHVNMEIIMLGGILNKESMVNLGVTTYQDLELIRADVYVMGIHNIDVELGTSVPTLTEAQIKRKMIEVSNQTIGICTSDKIGTVSTYIISPSKDISILITENADKKVVADFKKKDIQVINIQTE